MKVLTKHALLGFWMLCALFTYGQSHISPDDKHLLIEGSNYIKMKDDELIIHRHSDAMYRGTIKSNLFNPLKARSSSGIVLSFKTKSPRVVARFKIAKGLSRNPVFAVFQNGKHMRDVAFRYAADTTIEMILHSNFPADTPVVYSIAFPIKTDIHFLGLEMPDGFGLLPIEKKDKKGVYVAFGDSITHGVGQRTTPQTYPYQVAKMLDMSLYNVAVGGAKTSKVLAKMVSDDFPHIDLITILAGFNDYNSEGASTAEYKKRYMGVVKTIRSKHPETNIYCITLLTTKSKHSKTSGIAAEEYRAVVRGIVKDCRAAGDKKIFLVEGKDLTEESDLKDNVHLNPEGAKRFAQKLTQQIVKTIE